ncbi:hypothetical protein BT67DRAFT_232006 [Trichocladium antarcticum]|uniref:Uncharacterized protein n=1 Tax=Trichocladium antarcticum TaxID=1450529 RepID=A0AAN6UQN8_9PEZI|nr:hypothetical protein BT67DRAFT_232006 [Trichocladium antarcticum]
MQHEDCVGFSGSPCRAAPVSSSAWCYGGPPTEDGLARAFSMPGWAAGDRGYRNPDGFGRDEVGVQVLCSTIKSQCVSMLIIDCAALGFKTTVLEQLTRHTSQEQLRAPNPSLGLVIPESFGRRGVWWGGIGCWWLGRWAAKNARGRIPTRHKRSPNGKERSFRDLNWRHAAPCLLRI